MGSFGNIEVNETVLMAYINAELSPSDVKTVEAWLNDSDDNRTYFEKLKKTWDLSGELSPKPVAVNTDEAWLNVKAKIEETKVIPLPTKSSSIIKYIAAAAGLALLVTVYMLWRKPLDDIEILANNHIIEHDLSDGTTVTINENSQLTYSESFNQNERRVKLTGEAYFDVARDESHPFIIELPDNFYVKVLGTSFTINTNDNNATSTVFVTSGKVEFGNDDEKIFLTANEKAIYHHQSQTFEKINADTKKTGELYWINEQLVFEGEKLSDIIMTLENIFDADIDLLCDGAAEYPIVSNHQYEDLPTILEVICLVHDLKLTVNNVANHTQYIISCND